MIKYTLIFSFLFLFLTQAATQKPPVVPIYNVSLRLADSIKAYRKIDKHTTEQALRMYKTLANYLFETQQMTNIEKIEDIQDAFRDNDFIYNALNVDNFWELIHIPSQHVIYSK